MDRHQPPSTMRQTNGEIK